MNNEEKILSMLERMQSDIAGIKDDIAKIKEVQAEHSEALDALIEWTDNVQEIVRVPFAKVKAAK